MASYTTNLNLKKPAGSENVAIGDINNNMDAIDQAYGTLNSKILQGEIDYLGGGTAEGDVTLSYVSGHKYRFFMIGTTEYWASSHQSQGFFGNSSVIIPLSVAWNSTNQYANVHPADGSWSVYFDIIHTPPKMTINTIPQNTEISVFGIY